jgi:hypothetical protein
MPGLLPALCTKQIKPAVHERQAMRKRVKILLIDFDKNPRSNGSSRYPRWIFRYLMQRCGLCRWQRGVVKFVDTRYGNTLSVTRLDRRHVASAAMGCFGLVLLLLVMVRFQHLWVIILNISKTSRLTFECREISNENVEKTLFMHTKFTPLEYL